jgi:hypothetical protein
VSTVQAHANAVLALLRADAVLTVYDGAVPTGAPDHYVVVDMYRVTQDGVAAPDKTDLTFTATAVDFWVYAHCVGGDAAAVRAVAGRVEDRLLNVTPTVAGRSCFPIRHRDSSPPTRDELSGPLVQELTDVYGFLSIPG